MRRAGRRHDAEAEAYSVARKFLGQVISRGDFSRQGSKTVTQTYDEMHRDDLIQEILESNISQDHMEEIIEAVSRYRARRSKTGPNPRDLEFRNFVICWVIQGVERIVQSNTRAQSIVLDVLAELGSGLDEDYLGDIWQSRKKMSFWSNVEAMDVWPGIIRR